MTNQFITLPKAAQLTGKSLPTITRLARKYQNTKHVKKEGKKYLVSSQLINQNYSVTNQNDYLTNQNNQEKETGTLEAKNETISLLKSELEQKNRQINDLTERIRENNIIIQNLQNRLQIPESFSETNEVTESHPESSGQKKDYKSVIIELYKQNYTHREIANHLNQNGYLNTLGRPFTVNSIDKIISRLKKKNIL
ncbi:MAG: hypothetical protein R6V23_16215 [Bacteroidales bacterium]